MRGFSVHRSAVSRYMSKSGGFKRSSIGRRGSYKLGASKFESYLQEAKKLTDDIKGEEKSEETENTAVKSSALSKYTRTKANNYKPQESKFNSGSSAIKDSAESFDELLKNDEFDKDKAFAAAEKFVSGYNALASSVKNSSNSAVSNKSRYISDITSIYSRTLEKVGVTADLKGNLSIDKDKFMAADVKDLEAVFSGKSSFSAHVSEQADSIKLLSDMSASTYSSDTADRYTSALSGSLFSGKF